MQRDLLLQLQSELESIKLLLASPNKFKQKAIRRFKVALECFDVAAQDFAFKGGTHPSEWPRIETEYIESKDRVLNEFSNILHFLVGQEQNERAKKKTRRGK